MTYEPLCCCRHLRTLAIKPERATPTTDEAAGVVLKYLSLCVTLEVDVQFTVKHLRLNRIFHQVRETTGARAKLRVVLISDFKVE